MRALTADVTEVELDPRCLVTALELLHHLWDPTDRAYAKWRGDDFAETLACFHAGLEAYARPLQEARMDARPYREPVRHPDRRGR